jgi:hypothetical protein
MPRKKRNSETQGLIDACLDEIENAHELLGRKNLSDKSISALNGWIRKQKALLKELGYKGAMPRKARSTKT